MSGGTACREHPRDRWVVIALRSRRSAFDGYRVMPSRYSAVRCLDCHRVWRTRAAYVSALPLAVQAAQ